MTVSVSVSVNCRESWVHAYLIKKSGELNRICGARCQILDIHAVLKISIWKRTITKRSFFYRQFYITGTQLQIWKQHFQALRSLGDHIHQQQTHRDRYILDVLRPVNRKGSYQSETKCIPTTSTNSASLHIPTLKSWRKWSWMSWEGRNQVGIEAL